MVCSVGFCTMARPRLGDVRISADIVARLLLQRRTCGLAQNFLGRHSTDVNCYFTFAVPSQLELNDCSNSGYLLCGVASAVCEVFYAAHVDEAVGVFYKSDSSSHVAVPLLVKIWRLTPRLHLAHLVGILSRNF